MTTLKSDSYEIGGPERTSQRTEIVRLLHRLGRKETEIIQRLQNDGYIPLIWSFGKKTRLIRDDIRRVRKEDMAKFKSVMQDSDSALVDYIGRLQTLFDKAYEDGDWQLCRDLTKDIAKAHGVPTEEPIRIETDILSQMQLAFQTGMRRVSEQKNLPSPVINEENGN